MKLEEKEIKLKKVQKQGAQSIVLDSIKKGNITPKQIREDTGLTEEVVYQATVKLRRWGIIETICLGKYRVEMD